MATVPADVEGPSDAELIDAVRKGTVSAYGSLYERHVASAYNLARQLSRSPAEADDLVSEAFAKVLDTLRAGRGPDSAFRAYLLTALRHTAYDKTRRDRKLELADDVSTVSGVPAAAVSEEFDDTAVAGLDRSLAAQAFARLPERWQAVLWHTEIEGQSPAEVAPILGLTANGVSALAYRAREGLRQAYLQVHLAETTDKSCRAAAEKLGAWTRGGLAKREKAQVESHLDGCDRCRALAAELADVNGAMRGFVAPLVLGVGATGYLAATGITKVATITTATTASGAAGAAGAAASGPRQFLGVAASGVALAAAIAVGLTAGGGSPQIPAAAPQPTQEQPEPNPPEPNQPNQPNPPAADEPPPDQPAPDDPAPDQPAPDEPAPNQPPPPPPDQPAPAVLDAAGPSTPVALVAGGGPADLPLTVTNSGGSMSEPITAVLNLPHGVSAIPVDGLAAPRLLSLNGVKAGTVNCPGGTGTVSCSSGAGLAPGESVTLLFRLLAAEDSRGGQVTGTISAGSSVNVSVSVPVQVKETYDDITLAASARWPGLFPGLLVHPVIDVRVQNTGTSSRPVTVRLDQRSKVRWSSQKLTCSLGGGTTCVTPAEVAPGETLKIVFEVHADPWPVRSPGRHRVSVTAELGSASENVQVKLWGGIWPGPPAPPHSPPHSPSPDPTTTTAPPPPPDNPTHHPPLAPDPSDKPTVPKPTEPPPGSSTVPPGPPSEKPGKPTEKPGKSTEKPDKPGKPPPSPSGPERSDQPPSGGGGGLGGFLGWFLGY